VIWIYQLMDLKFNLTPVHLEVTMCTKFGDSFNAFELSRTTTYRDTNIETTGNAKPSLHKWAL